MSRLLIYFFQIEFFFFLLLLIISLKFIYYYFSGRPGIGPGHVCCLGHWSQRGRGEDPVARHGKPFGPHDICR